MRIVSVLNHKGGVGKTTFTGSVAQALALVGFRVLAIDNDSQHNLSSLLRVGTRTPSIKDIHSAPDETAPEILFKSIRHTEIADLHVITSCKDLCDSDIQSFYKLKSTIDRCRLDRFYDFIIIDNAPGLDKIQASALYASHEIFVPTELRQFAIDGIVEMDQILKTRYADLTASIQKIIPNFYRAVRRQDAFIAALKKLFPGKITDTVIPIDSVFDEVVTDGKILFLHRLYSKGAAVYLKLIHELFNMDEEKVWDMVMEKRNSRIREEARTRLVERKRETHGK